MTCKAKDKEGRVCEYDATHSDGEYQKHKTSWPVTTEQGFKAKHVCHWQNIDPVPREQ